MSEEDKKENLCANCKYKMREWKCMKDYERDYVTGIKRFGTCEHHRNFDDCRDFESKGAGRTKTEDQLTIANEVSYIVTTASTSLIALGLLGLLTAMFILGR